MARKLTYNELEQTVNELEKDILVYKNAKEIAVKDKEELACILNAIPDHIATIDNQFRIQRVNKSLADKLKCSPEGLKRKPCYRYICKADHPPISCPHAQMLNDGKEHSAQIFNKQFGTNLLVTSSPLFDDEGRLIGGVHVSRDITAHKETEESLSESD
ncbi:MAG: PAS domain-containing protein [Proteobacteria bacterium]|nr:PAS domain-containing protein [Pseudomonadota bacterium]